MQLTIRKQRLGAFIVAAVTASAIGCGGSSNDSRFLGTWKITQASANVTCDDGTSGSFVPSGNLEFAPGTTTAIVAVSPSVIDPSSFCDFGFDIKGAVASVHGTQSCTLIGLSAGTTAAGEASFSPVMWTFSITGPDTAEEVGSATIKLPALDATGTMIVGTTLCQYSAHMATLTRVARN